MENERRINKKIRYAKLAICTCESKGKKSNRVCTTVLNTASVATVALLLLYDGVFPSFFLSLFHALIHIDIARYCSQFSIAHWHLTRRSA